MRLTLITSIARTTVPKTLGFSTYVANGTDTDSDADGVDRVAVSHLGGIHIFQNLIQNLLARAARKNFPKICCFDQNLRIAHTDNAISTLLVPQSVYHDYRTPTMTTTHTVQDSGV